MKRALLRVYPLMLSNGGGRTRLNGRTDSKAMRPLIGSRCMLANTRRASTLTEQFGVPCQRSPGGLASTS